MTVLHRLELSLGNASYPIFIGQDILTDAELIRQYIKGSEVLVVTSESLAGLYLDGVVAALDGLKVGSIVLPDGENHKTLESLDFIFTRLLELGHTRQTTLIALGGGVIGDMTGFAAACYQRGVRFLQMPTTLLSQVDASVGGKTAVNHVLGKNMIGAFHQPAAVFVDINSLTSLPKRELVAGLAEVIKHAMLADKELFSWLENNIDKLLALADEEVAFAIARNCEIKASIVSQDETEQGIRALLNLGHTFAHAIETSQGYGSWVHGEAVGVGLVMAADLSVRLNMLDKESANRVKCLVERAGLPVLPPPQMAVDEYIQLMGRDKKATAAGMRFVLLKSIGQACICDDVSETALIETLEAGNRLCA